MRCTFPGSKSTSPFGREGVLQAHSLILQLSLSLHTEPDTINLHFWYWFSVFQSVTSATSICVRFPLRMESKKIIYLGGLSWGSCVHRLVRISGWFNRRNYRQIYIGFLCSSCSSWIYVRLNLQINKLKLKPIRRFVQRPLTRNKVVFRRWLSDG